jgi:hypothetical protein
MVYHIYNSANKAKAAGKKIKNAHTWLTQHKSMYACKQYETKQGANQDRFGFLPLIIIKADKHF